MKPQGVYFYVYVPFTIARKCLTYKTVDVMLLSILGYLLSVLIVVPLVLYLFSLRKSQNEYLNNITYQMLGVILATIICVVWICIKPSAWWILLIELVVLCCIARFAIKDKY